MLDKILNLWSTLCLWVFGICFIPFVVVFLIFWIVALSVFVLGMAPVLFVFTLINWVSQVVDKLKGNFSVHRGH